MVQGSNVNLNTGGTVVNWAPSTSSTIPMGTNTGTQSTYRPQSTYNPQTTYNPQQGAPSPQTTATGIYNTPYSGSGYIPVNDGSGYVQGASTYSQQQAAQQAAQREAARQAAAEAARLQQLRDNFGVKQGGLLTGTESDIRGARTTFNNQGQDLVTGLRTGQNDINSGRVNNALNLRRGMAAIASGLRQGIRSGGVSLANMNAMDSSASEAMARAFARQGNQQAASANNQSQLAENELRTKQENLDLQRNQGLGRLNAWRDNVVRDIGDKLRQGLAELDADARGQGLGGFIDMGAKDRLVAQASAELSAVDQTTQAELAKVRGLDMGQVNQQASEMDVAGASVNNPFTIEGTNTQWGQVPSGAPLGTLPTAPRFRDEQQMAFNPFLRDEEVRV